MCMAGWGKHWTRRCQGWNCFENRFCLHRTSENSREKYSIKEHLWLKLKSNKHFPFGVDSKRSLFSLVHPRAQPYNCVKGNVWYTEIQNEAEAVSMALLMAQVMILGKGQIIPWKPSIADLIKSRPKVSSGSDRFQPWVFSAFSELPQKWEASA